MCHTFLRLIYIQFFFFGFLEFFKNLRLKSYNITITYHTQQNSKYNSPLKPIFPVFGVALQSMSHLMTKCFILNLIINFLVHSHLPEKVLSPVRLNSK